MYRFHRSAAVTLALAAALALPWTVHCLPAQESSPPDAKVEDTNSAVLHVDAVQAAKLWKSKQVSKDFAVLDVRRPSEFESAHIPNAVLIDVSADDFEAKAKKLDKAKTYLVHCRSGNRSRTAVKKLTALGFTKLVHLDGGLIAWEKAGNPVEQGGKKSETD